MDTITPLAALILSALLSLNPRPNTDADMARAVVVAQEIEAAVEGADKLPVTGDAAKEGSALALVAVGWHESKFRADIADCRACDGKSALCDRGTSISSFQMKQRAWGGNTREQVCADGSLAASLSLRLMASHKVSMPGVFRAYARGGAEMPSKPAAEITAIYEKLLNKFRFRFIHKVVTEVSPAPTPRAKAIKTEESKAIKIARAVTP